MAGCLPLWRGSRTLRATSPSGMSIGLPTCGCQNAVTLPTSGDRRLPAGARTAPADRPHSLRQGRRDPGAATRGRRAPPHQHETTPGVGGGPGSPRRPHPAATDEAVHRLVTPGTILRRHRRLVRRRDLPEPTRPPPDRRRPRRAGHADGAGEPEVGIPRGFRASCSDSAIGSAPRLSTPTPAGGSSYAPGPPRCWPWTSSTSTGAVTRRGTDVLFALEVGDRYPHVLGVTSHPRRTVDHPTGPQPPDGPRRTHRTITVRIAVLEQAAPSRPLPTAHRPRSARSAIALCGGLLHKHQQVAWPIRVSGNPQS